MVTYERPFDLPRLASAIQGTGGVFKQEASDFRVEEIPLYEASGTGPHIYLTVRKENIGTPQLVRKVAAVLQIRPDEIGYAGLKDAKAVAVQRISVPERAEARLSAVDALEGVEVLETRRHRNKIKRGHLLGNRFKVVIRGVGGDAGARAEEVLSVLRRRGVPNGFDAQRFGRFVNTHRLGRLLVVRDAEGFAREFLAPEGRPRRQEVLDAFEKGDLEVAAECFPPSMKDERRFAQALSRSGAEKAVRVIPRRMRGLYVSAFQAFLFNLTLERRGIDCMDRLFDGDLACLHRNGAVFHVERAEDELPRLEAFEISPSGPLYGLKAPLAEGRQGEMEAEVAREYQVEREAFRGLGMKVPGDRRPYRVPLLEEPTVREVEGRALEVSFSLPSGAYATLALREIIGSGREDGVKGNA